MVKSSRVLTISVLALALSACASMAPPRTELPPAAVGTIIPSAFPAVPGDKAVIGVAADLPWSSYYADPALRSLIERALVNNRDLRMAVINVERARAQARIARSPLLPSAGVGAQASIGSGTDSYQSSVNGSYEVDLFGKLRNQSAAAQNALLSQEQNARTAQQALVSQIAQLYLTSLADRAQASLASSTLKNNQEVLDLVDKRHTVGVANGLELAQARSQVEAARTALAQYQGQIEQDKNLMTLLIGEPVPDSVYARKWDSNLVVVPPLPANLPSEVLLRRPDIMSAEYSLRAANANVAAARAAFFPSIALTGSAGLGGTSLSDLVSGKFLWNFVPKVTLPIFTGGALQGQHEVAKAEQDLALANYEKTIQSGFREVADGMALLRTQQDQLNAQTNLVRAASRANELVRVRYRYGYDSYLNMLDSQRSLYQAQSALINAQLAAQLNRVKLYQSLGGGASQ